MNMDPVRLITANGESSSLKQGKVYIPSLGKVVDPYLVESTPAVLSVGMRCVDDGYDFVWRGSKKQDPYFLKPNGERIYLKVNDYVPYLTNEGSKIGVSAPAFKGAIVKPRDAVPSVDKSDEVLEAAEKIEEGMYEPSAAGQTPDIEELQGDEPLERGYVEAPREGESFEPSFEKSVGSSSSVLDVDVKAKRDLGEKALRKEAQSKGHSLTHLPKNPYCDVCTKAKMIKRPSRAKGGSTKVEADVFGDHITGDFLVTMTEDEEGIDTERVALVVKDVATGFQYVYPTARRNAESIIISMKHFTSPGDKIGIFYSDNAPELVSAMKVLQWRHVISKDYISKSNAVAERLVRSVLEGTRVNLLQAGLHHQYWPHAARHWCFMCNVIQVGEETTPWKIRFGEDFKGPKIPFGCQIDYWTGPRKRPKPDLKYEPTSKPGIFLGYVVHPGFDFRTEFIVASLKEIRLASFDEKVNVLRVIKVNEPEIIRFPLKDRQDRIREGRESQASIDDIDQEDSIEAQDSKPVREPEPSGKAEGASSPSDPNSVNPGKRAVYNPGWSAFMKHVNDKEGWYEFADAWVRVEVEV